MGLWRFGLQTLGLWSLGPWSCGPCVHPACSSDFLPAHVCFFSHLDNPPAGKHFCNQLRVDEAFQEFTGYEGMGFYSTGKTKHVSPGFKKIKCIDQNGPCFGSQACV